MSITVLSKSGQFAQDCIILHESSIENFSKFLFSQSSLLDVRSCVLYIV